MITTDACATGYGGVLRQQDTEEYFRNWIMTDVNVLLLIPNDSMKYKKIGRHTNKNTMHLFNSVGGFHSLIFFIMKLNLNTKKLNHVKSPMRSADNPVQLKISRENQNTFDLSSTQSEMKKTQIFSIAHSHFNDTEGRTNRENSRRATSRQTLH